jgi:hypothetical protein
VQAAVIGKIRYVDESPMGRHQRKSRVAFAQGCGVLRHQGMRAIVGTALSGANPRAPLRAAAALLLAALAGCASSQAELVGRARPAISPDQVRIYLQPPESKYEQIANLAASSRGSFTLTSAGQTDKVIERLKQRAAQLGANGLLLYGVGNQTSRAVGAAVNVEDETTHSPYGLGVGAWGFFYRMSGEGMAIYVEPK